MFQRLSDTSDGGRRAAVTAAGDGDARAVSTPAGVFECSLCHHYEHIAAVMFKVITDVNSSEY